MKKATHSEEQSRLSKAHYTKKPLNKTARILKVMLDGGSLNRFDAEPVGDHCLNSTISTLKNHYGLVFNRSWERVPNRWGSHTPVVRYSLSEAEREKGQVIMNLLTRTRRSLKGRAGDE
ncbi:hypothetical protein [Marinobacter sp. VGCF2001]|uniref:hypothetical protein n=1 Tax=Marinobacter sp. VGCF2001 TaxID=3417189 RepID=UPI003CFAFEA8